MKIGDHIWNTEKMQLQKEQRNASSASACINMRSKTANIKRVLGDKQGDNGRITITDRISILCDGSHQQSQQEEKNRPKKLRF
jgi:hypothetical protein